MEFKHYSVMLGETVDGLNVHEGGIYADGTLGGGGHSYEILSRAEDIRLIGIDQDTDALSAAKGRLSEFGEKVTYINDNFRNINSVLDGLGIDKIDGMVLDLGVSSYQLDNAMRGFSYMQDAPLDMRMNKTAKLSAYDVVNGYSEDELTDIFYRFGEENWSRRIAKFITDKRKIKPISTTYELSDIIKAAIPQAARKDVAHPEKRVFQAIRIEVNGELEILKTAICDIVGRLKKGGRLSVITFHSLEDRIVKQTFLELAKGCTCPPEFPVCVCGGKPEIKVITKKPILPSNRELEENSRSKSAKLRIAEKL